MPPSTRPASRSRLTLLAPGILAMVLAGLQVTGCHGSAPSLLLTVADPSEVGPDQLRVTVAWEDAVPQVIVRPETPGEPLSPGQTVRLLLPVQAIGVRLEVAVAGLAGGSTLAVASAEVDIVDGREVSLQVALVPVAQACSPETCETGCCREGACVPDDGAPCDGASACESCDPLRSDACVDDTCRCGEGPACSLKIHVCRNGACVDEDFCETDADCVELPEGACVEYTGACVNNICESLPKDLGEPCEDGDLCTENSVCDGAGNCGSGTEVVCEAGDNPCLIYNPTCSPTSGCSRPVANGAVCSAPGSCTISTCADGVCIPEGPACAPGEYCCPDEPGLCHDAQPDVGAPCFLTPP